MTSLLDRDHYKNNLLDRTDELLRRMADLERQAATGDLTVTVVEIWQPAEVQLGSDTSAGATSCSLEGLPDGPAVQLGWFVFDPYTIQCEIRKWTGGTATAPTFAALTYDHDEGDPVLWITEPFYNVKWYTAAGDGSTDDTSAIQAAIADVGTGSARLYFPAGHYMVSSKITFPTTTGNFVVEGDGLATVIESTHETGDEVFYIHDYVPSDFRVVIRDLHLKGPGRTSSSGDGIRAWNTTGVYIYNCNITDFAGAGVHFDGAQICSMHDCEAKRCGYGVRMGGAGGVGAYGQNLGAAGIFLYNIHLNSNTTAGLYMDYGTTGVGNNGIFGGIIQGNYQDGILLDGSANFTIDNIWFESNNSTSTANKADVRTEGQVAHLMISNCSMRGTDVGIDLGSTSAPDSTISVTIIETTTTNDVIFGARSYYVYCINSTLASGGASLFDSGTGNVLYQYQHWRWMSTWTPGTITAGSYVTTTITCPGVSAAGEPIQVGISSGLPIGCHITASYWSGNDVRVVISNQGGTNQTISTQRTLYLEQHGRSLPPSPSTLTVSESESLGLSDTPTVSVV